MTARDQLGDWYKKHHTKGNLDDGSRYDVIVVDARTGEVVSITVWRGVSKDRASRLVEREQKGYNREKNKVRAVLVGTAKMGDIISNL